MESQLGLQLCGLELQKKTQRTKSWCVFFPVFRNLFLDVFGFGRITFQKCQLSHVSQKQKRFFVVFVTVAVFSKKAKVFYKRQCRTSKDFRSTYRHLNVAKQKTLLQPTKKIKSCFLVLLQRSRVRFPTFNQNGTLEAWRAEEEEQQHCQAFNPSLIQFQWVQSGFRESRLNPDRVLGLLFFAAELGHVFCLVQSTTFFFVVFPCSKPLRLQNGFLYAVGLQRSEVCVFAEVQLYGPFASHFAACRS